jgi:hypothetical protein
VDAVIEGLRKEIEFFRHELVTTKAGKYKELERIERISKFGTQEIRKDKYRTGFTG